MLIEYIPKIGFIINKTLIKWGFERSAVRSYINEQFSISDFVIGETITQKRDIYENFKNQGCYFFVNYDENDLLRDFEVHNGIVVQVGNVILSDTINIYFFIEKFRANSYKIIEIENNYFLLPDINLIIASNEAIGGDGDALGYIYFASDISHIEKV